MKVQQLDHLNLSVHNLQASIDWYGALFGFEVVDGGVQNGQAWKILKSGEAMLCLYEDPRRSHQDRFALREALRHGLNHFALRIEDPNIWRARAKAEGITFSYDGPVHWPHSTSWYITDPTGYEIEVVHWHDQRIRFAS